MQLRMSFDGTPTLLEVPVESVKPNRRQPRTHFDQGALEELAASIRQHGILQPLVVRPSGAGYEIIAGERRWRASQLAGLEQVPVVVRDSSAMDALELALIENIQREDIGPLECARSYRRLIDEFGLTQEEVATKIGKSRVTIANTVRLLRLPPRIQESVDKGELSEGHAKALLQIEPEELQLRVFEEVIAGGWSVRDIEQLARKLAKADQPNSKTARSISSFSDLEEALSTKFGSRTKILGGEGGGRIVVNFASEDDLTRILDILQLQL